VGRKGCVDYRGVGGWDTGVVGLSSLPWGGDVWISLLHAGNMDVVFATVPPQLQGATSSHTKHGPGQSQRLYVCVRVC
jgi:hypothetical protein